MQIKELAKAYAAGKIEKHCYWTLMREEFRSLVELRDLLKM